MPCTTCATQQADRCLMYRLHFEVQMCIHTRSCRPAPCRLLITRIAFVHASTRLLESDREKLRILLFSRQAPKFRTVKYTSRRSDQKLSVAACSKGTVHESKRIRKIRQVHIFCRNNETRKAFEIKSAPTHSQHVAAVPVGYRCFCEYHLQ
jgi:hypothetical protein